jgi:hypothetical protein
VSNSYNLQVQTKNIMSATTLPTYVFEDVAEYEDHEYWLCTIQDNGIVATGASYAQSIAKTRAEAQLREIKRTRQSLLAIAQRVLLPSSPNYENSVESQLARESCLEEGKA